MTPDLALVFTVLMGVAILAYVVLDGYDLGIGMLMPAATEREQDLMVVMLLDVARCGVRAPYQGRGLAPGAVELVVPGSAHSSPPSLKG